MTDCQVEEWWPVVGADGYEVSNHGRVRSVDRTKIYHQFIGGERVPIKRRHRGIILSAGTLASGHQFVMLGRGCGALVHRLVLEAFVGPAPEGTECCHYDDNPSNNHVSNLRWDTRSANLADFYRNYGFYQGRRQADV